MKYICLFGLIVTIVSCQSTIVVDNNIVDNFHTNTKKISKEQYIKKIESMKISDSIKLEMHRRISKMDMNFEALQFYLFES